MKQLVLSPIVITEEDKKEFRSYTDSAIVGIKLIRLQSDDCLFDLLKSAKRRKPLERAIGPDTNPTWVTARIAETLYDRGTIDETEFDRLTR